MTLPFVGQDQPELLTWAGAVVVDSVLLGSGFFVVVGGMFVTVFVVSTGVTLRLNASKLNGSRVAFGDDRTGVTTELGVVVLVVTSTLESRSIGETMTPSSFS